MMAGMEELQERILELENSDDENSEELEALRDELDVMRLDYDWVWEE